MYIYIPLSSRIQRLDNGRIKTSTYRKTTFTGLMMGYFSFCPRIYKLSLINTLLDRIYKINNTWDGINNDFNKLKEILLKNCYPRNLIDQLIRQFVNSKNNDENNTTQEPTTDNYYFKLPFIGHTSNVTVEKIKFLTKYK